MAIVFGNETGRPSIEENAEASGEKYNYLKHNVWGGF
jgi:hypothetical protein